MREAERVAAVALKDKGVPVPEIAKKLTIKTGKNAGRNPSVASLYRALAESEEAAADDHLSRSPSLIASAAPRTRSPPRRLTSVNGFSARAQSGFQWRAGLCQRDGPHSWKGCVCRVLDPSVRQVGWHRGETTQDEEEAAPFGIPKEIILLTGQNVWPYTFIADDSGGGCGKVPMPADATLQDVQTAIFTRLADLTPYSTVLRSTSNGPP
ncbi:hypothetical protein ACWCQL_26030 [Streptomyces sp. NPDC002073]